jgi:hypothetical protein
MATPNPLIEGSLALLAGNFIGAIVDRIVTIIDSRVKLMEALSLGSETNSLLDNVLGIFLHMGLITLGTKFAVGAMPWITEDMGANILFAWGLQSASPHLELHLKSLNSFLFDENVYKTEGQRKRGETGEVSTPE